MEYFSKKIIDNALIRKEKEGHYLPKISAIRYIKKKKVRHKRAYKDGTDLGSACSNKR